MEPPLRRPRAFSGGTSICVPVLALAGLAAAQDGAIPPERTPVEMVVSGRTSTLRSIVVEDVGHGIPRTFAGDRLVDVEGFAWFVSRHYALQTDYDSARARHLLTVLELAYPHYVELFGREIPGIDTTRMAVVYGASKESLDEAMRANGIVWDFGGGGITYEGLNIAYQYPSGTLQYHQRYILLHECAHLYQICLEGTTLTTPGWYYEGVADALAHHVWDSAARRLTVEVVDKPTVNNWYQAGMEVFATEPFAASDILAGRRGGRALGFLLVSYLGTDLERTMRWRIWRDEMFAARLYGSCQEASNRLLDELFGADALDRDFAAWLRAHHSSFHYVDWGWEQDGDALMSYGWPQSGAYSETDLLFKPREAPQYDPLVMDYPLHSPSELVGEVRRGGDEPSVGCTVGFAENPDAGEAGMALGVEGRSFAKVLIEERRRLTLDASALGGERRSLDLPDAFRAATQETFLIGLTIRIGHEALEVTARAGEGAASRALELSLPLTAVQRQRLLDRPLAVISRDGRHWITPYVDAARHAEPDLSRPAPCNRWRFAWEPELYALTRAVWRLGEEAPASLREARARLVRAAQGDAAAQAQAGAAYLAARERLRADVRGCSADPASRAKALAELGE